MRTRARVAYLAVESRHGPHVTPHQFACGPDRLWLVASRTSLKVRAIRRRPRVGVLLRDFRRSVLISGRAEVLSPFDPWAAAPLTAFAQQNVSAMLGYALDLPASPEGANPADRVLLSVRIERTLGFDERWTGGPAVVGWSGPLGPLALPASWDGGRAHVATEVIDGTAAPAASPACVVFDRSDGIRPSRFRGLLLRGQGVLTSSVDGWSRVELSVERVTRWEGFTARSAPAGTEPQSLVGSS